MPSKGTVIWRGDYGRPENDYSITRIEGVTDDTALGTLITALASHTDCNIAKRIFNTITLVTDAAPAADANVDRKAMLFMRNPTTLHVVRLELPAPKAASVEAGEAHEKMTSAAEAAILAAVNTACGTSYTVLSSKVVQRA